MISIQDLINLLNSNTYIFISFPSTSLYNPPFFLNIPYYIYRTQSTDMNAKPKRKEKNQKYVYLLGGIFLVSVIVLGENSGILPY